MDLNKISSEIISSAIMVHKELGPGLLDSVYHSCTVVELFNRGINYQSEVSCPVRYRGIKVNDERFRMDLVVEDTIVVELKSVENVQPVHKKQLLTYLSLDRKTVGLVDQLQRNKAGGWRKEDSERFSNQKPGKYIKACLSPAHCVR